MNNDIGGYIWRNCIMDTGVVYGGIMYKGLWRVCGLMQCAV